MDFDTQFKNGYYRLDGPRLPIFSSVCSYCTHYQLRRKCQAFPDGIPLEIWLGKNPHTEPFPGDHNIQFEPVKL